jgi:hypothetical protein
MHCCNNTELQNRGICTREWVSLPERADLFAQDAATLVVDPGLAVVAKHLRLLVADGKLIDLILAGCHE